MYLDKENLTSFREKFSYYRETARRPMSVGILSTALPLQLYEKIAFEKACNK